jgi:hypothetical protein
MCKNIHGTVSAFSAETRKMAKEEKGAEHP